MNSDYKLQTTCTRIDPTSRVMVLPVKVFTKICIVRAQIHLEQRLIHELRFGWQKYNVTLPKSEKKQKFCLTAYTLYQDGGATRKRIICGETSQYAGTDSAESQKCRRGHRQPKQTFPKFFFGLNIKNKINTRQNTLSTRKISVK